jgi:hypothetical protein
VTSWRWRRGRQLGCRRQPAGNRRTETPGHTPGKAEGEETDVEEALQE